MNIWERFKKRSRVNQALIVIAIVPLAPLWVIVYAFYLVIDLLSEPR